MVKGFGLTIGATIGGFVGNKVGKLFKGNIKEQV